MRREFWDEMEDYFAMQKVKLRKKQRSARGGGAGSALSAGSARGGGVADSEGSARARGVAAAGGKAPAGGGVGSAGAAGSALARAAAAGCNAAAGGNACEGLGDGRALGAMYCRRYYQKHREQIRQSQREYLAANLERCREAGARLRAARLARGWTQAQLGRALGVSKAAVCHWERGRVPFDAQRLARLPRLMADVCPGAGRTGQGQAQNAAADEAKTAPQTGTTGKSSGQPETDKKACPGAGAKETLRGGLANGRADGLNGGAAGHLAGFGAKQECATAEAQNLRKGRGDDEQGA